MSQYLAYEDIKAFHIELSSHCNAACPMCARNIFGAHQNPKLLLNHITLEQMQKAFDKELCRRLKYIMFCGTNGDPMMNPEILPITSYLKDCDTPVIHVFTNGSMGRPQLWRELGKLMSGPNDLMVFSIDGLEDTNALYRRGTNYSRIMKNATAFMDAGGNARWDFLVFEHNEHQVEAARDLARDMGFAEFRIRKTSRFVSPHNRVLSEFPVFKKSKDLEEAYAEHGIFHVYNLPADYYLKPPQDPKYQSIAVTKQAGEIEKKYGDYNNYLETSSINCLYREKFKRYYITSDFRLWPCSYIPADFRSQFTDNQFAEELDEKVFARYGNEFNRLDKFTMQEIIEHPWYKGDLVSGWDPNCGQDTRLKKCARTCGDSFDPILSQTQDTNLRNEKEKRSFGY